MGEFLRDDDGSLEAEEKEEKLRRELDKKKKKINMFYIQQKSWEEGLALKNKELGVLNGKVEAQGLTLAEMTTREGETVALALPLADNDAEALEQPTISKMNTSVSRTQDTDPSVFENLQDL
ncbi:Uncharacterized protein Fot_04070 [Forsythia ovata]|uniref:Uncharacterized protein n=1 Tax=Forsythia ovata TaxID=205694 RepID=A0ABD1XBI8_9LAMI